MESSSRTMGVSLVPLLLLLLGDAAGLAADAEAAAAALLFLADNLVERRFCGLLSCAIRVAAFLAALLVDRLTGAESSSTPAVPTEKEGAAVA